MEMFVYLHLSPPDVDMAANARIPHKREGNIMTTKPRSAILAFGALLCAVCLLSGCAEKTPDPVSEEQSSTAGTTVSTAASTATTEGTTAAPPTDAPSETVSRGSTTTTSSTHRPNTENKATKASAGEPTAAPVKGSSLVFPLVYADRVAGDSPNARYATFGEATPYETIAENTKAALVRAEQLPHFDHYNLFLARDAQSGGKTVRKYGVSYWFRDADDNWWELCVTNAEDVISSRSRYETDQNYIRVERNGRVWSVRQIVKRDDPSQRYWTVIGCFDGIRYRGDFHNSAASGCDTPEQCIDSLARLILPTGR